ncbi:MAG: universal stress protein [Anaerolineae bacterium]|jgi:nucleotide-binding universal stress UspA family protein
MFKKLLVPVDGSAHSTRAVKAAGELADCCGASICLLHVIRDLSLPKEILSMMAAGEVTASRMQILQDSADIILDNARTKIEAAGVEEVTTQCLMGDPATKILEYAAEQGVDVIVLGLRGLGPNPDLLGGVARKIVNRTTVSCLVVT